MANKNGITVLSLFDGMSCGQIALKKMGVKIENYYAAEIDKFAIKEVKENFPNTKHLGDVENYKEWDINWSDVDLLIGGSPCQGFSFAGKQLAFDDPRSKLFFVYVDILNHIREHNPNIKFMLENVKMKKEYLDIISDSLGVQPLLINSSLVSAQSRQRYYWANWDFDLPKDKGLVLADIIDDHEFDHISNSNFLNGNFGDKKIIEHVSSVNQKSSCLTANMWKGQIPSYIKTDIEINSIVLSEKSQTILSTIHKENSKSMIKRKKKGLLVGLCNRVDTATDIRGHDSVKRVYAQDGKSPTLSTCQGGHREPKVQIKESENNECLMDVHYRKLTVKECCRLQTVPDDYFKVSSKTQSYKMLGNGWTVDVIVHIFNNLFFKG